MTEPDRNAPPRLELAGVVTDDSVGFSVRLGEIPGIAGVAGTGRNDLLARARPLPADGARAAST